MNNLHKIIINEQINLNKQNIDVQLKLIENDYIDCPWWPDIGMPKAKFLKYFGLDWLIKEKNNSPVTIMDYYDGKDANFASKMMKHYWFEKNAPDFIKKFWSHHKYFLFEPK